MKTNFTDEALRLISKVTDAIKFPDGDENFDGLLDDCIDALEGKELPSYYSTAGFDFPQDIPQDGYFPMLALHYLMDGIDEHKVSVPDGLRKEVEDFFSSNGISFEWDKEKFIMASVYGLEEDRLEELCRYEEELVKEVSEKEEKLNKVEEKLYHLRGTISHVARALESVYGKKPSEQDRLMLMVAFAKERGVTEAEFGKAVDEFKDTHDADSVCENA